MSVESAMKNKTQHALESGYHLTAKHDQSEVNDDDDYYYTAM